MLRSLLLAAALPSLLIACGDDGQEAPSGPHYTYVASSAKVPTSNTEANEYGLDLDGDKQVDNALGKVLATLAAQGGFDIQGAVDLAVADGSIILLMDLQTPSFSSAGGAGLQIKLGDNPSPAPCTDPANPTVATCGKHLTGSGMFSISSSSPSDAGVVGKISGGTFNGGPGDITLQIALGADPVNLTLIGARAKATGMSENGLTEVVLAGALTKDDLDNEVLPAIHTQLQPLIQRDCTGTAPSCCTAGSTGETIVNLFDTSEPRDCMVSLEEIKTNSLITSLTAPDVEINGQAALSLGIKTSAVKAVVQ